MSGGFNLRVYAALLFFYQAKEFSALYRIYIRLTSNTKQRYGSSHEAGPSVHMLLSQRLYAG
jgi:hypothetical protein